MIMKLLRLLKIKIVKFYIKKNFGYGDALIHGINYIDSELFCIFNADGSFNPARNHKYVEHFKKTK